MTQGRRFACVLAAVAIVAALCVRLPAGPKAPAGSAGGPDSVEGLAEQAVKAFNSGDNSGAIALFQKAIAVIQKEMEKSLAGLFPEAPTGWSAGKMKAGSAAFASGASTSWTHVTRTYTRKADKATAEISLTNSPQFTAAAKQVSAMYSNPQFVKMVGERGQLKISPIARDGWSGWAVINNKGNSAEAMAFSPGGNMAAVKIRKADEAALMMFWKALNLKAVEAPPAVKKPGKGK